MKQQITTEHEENLCVEINNENNLNHLKRRLDETNDLLSLEKIKLEQTVVSDENFKIKQFQNNLNKLVAPQLSKNMSKSRAFRP